MPDKQVTEVTQEEWDEQAARYRDEAMKEAPPGYTFEGFSAFMMKVIDGKAEKIFVCGFYGDSLEKGLGEIKELKMHWSTNPMEMKVLTFYELCTLLLCYEKDILVSLLVYKDASGILTKPDGGSLQKLLISTTDYTAKKVSERMYVEDPPPPKSHYN